MVFSGDSHNNESDDSAFSASQQGGVNRGRSNRCLLDTDEEGEEEEEEQSNQNCNQFNMSPRRDDESEGSASEGGARPFELYINQNRNQFNMSSRGGDESEVSADEGEARPRRSN